MKHALIFLTALLLISLDSLYAVATDSPIDIGSRRELFVVHPVKAYLGAL